MKLRLTAAIAAGACAVAIGACGGDDETPAETGPRDPTPLSKSEYLEQADRLCARANEQLDAIEDERDFQTEGSPIIQSTLAALGALPAPSRDQEQLDKVFAAGEDGLSTLEAATKPPRRDPFARFTQLAEDYGFEGGCTNN